MRFGADRSTGTQQRCPQAELQGVAREYLQAEGRRRLVNERLRVRLVRITEEGVGLMPGHAEQGQAVQPAVDVVCGGVRDVGEAGLVESVGSALEPS